MITCQEFLKWESSAVCVDFKPAYVDMAGGNVLAGLLLSQIAAVIMRLFTSLILSAQNKRLVGIHFQKEQQDRQRDNDPKWQQIKMESNESVPGSFFFVYGEAT